VAEGFKRGVEESGFTMAKIFLGKRVGRVAGL
jgi:hypothetical protein